MTVDTLPSDAAARDSALNALRAMFGARLSTGEAIRRQHGKDESYHPVVAPDAVFFDESTEEVARAVAICADHKWPVIPFGVGTSLEGGVAALHGGLSIDLSAMNQVLEVNAEDLDVRVQAGVTRKQLNEYLRDTGLFFPIDPGADASLGGMCATRASGTNAVRYGTMRDNVLGFEAVLADGRVIRTGTRARKSSAGYDLTGLLVGSEGTLALVTQMTVRLHGQPEAVSAAICAFPTMDQAVNAVIATIQLGIPMARIEFVDPACAAAINAYSGASFQAVPHLLLEFHGSETGVQEDAQRFREIADDFGGSDFQWAAQAEDRKALWAMRHNAHFACLASRPGARALVTDICVPISRLAQAVEETRADLAQASIPGPIVGHVGDGNFHSVLLFDETNVAERDEARKQPGSARPRRKVCRADVASHEGRRRGASFQQRGGGTLACPSAAGGEVQRRGAAHSSGG